MDKKEIELQITHLTQATTALKSLKKILDRCYVPGRLAIHVGPAKAWAMNFDKGVKAQIEHLKKLLKDAQDEEAKTK